MEREKGCSGKKMKGGKCGKRSGEREGKMREVFRVGLI